VQEPVGGFGAGEEPEAVGELAAGVAAYAAVDANRAVQQSPGDDLRCVFVGPILPWK